MEIWSSYALSDFLLFSPRVYERLFVLLNQDMWPAQVVALLAGIAIIVLTARHHWLAMPLGLAALSLAWASVTIVFFLGRYQAINWLGAYIAPFAVLQAAGLLLLAIVTWRRSDIVVRRMPPAALGLAYLVLALGFVAYPAIAVFLGYGIEAGQVAGVSADPTAVATLGLLAFLKSRMRWLAMIIPAAWCAFTGLTLWTLERPDAFIAPLAATIALIAAAMTVSARKRTR